MSRKQKLQQLQTELEKVIDERNALRNCDGLASGVTGAQYFVWKSLTARENVLRMQIEELSR